jgi:hypothetical protein
MKLPENGKEQGTLTKLLASKSLTIKGLVNSLVEGKPMPIAMNKRLLEAFLVAYTDDGQTSSALLEILSQKIRAQATPEDLQTVENKIASKSAVPISPDAIRTKRAILGAKSLLEQNNKGEDIVKVKYIGYEAHFISMLILLWAKSGQLWQANLDAAKEELNS